MIRNITLVGVEHDTDRLRAPGSEIRATPTFFLTLVRKFITSLRNRVDT